MRQSGAASFGKENNNVHSSRLILIYRLTYQDLEADGFPASTATGILSDWANFFYGSPGPKGAEAYKNSFSVLWVLVLLA